ncbi:MAG: oligosaccharide repeat unit polymerase [Pyrinomonadaceae bacterium]|nr:oligosaccharide repeat unit polymerase [Pyrinomonadaceae bacterium]
MYKARIQPNILQEKDAAIMFPLAILGALVCLGGLALLYLTDDTTNPFKQMYMMPWVFLLGVVIAAPNLYLIHKKRFNLFHPLTFAAWSYFIPAFFFGGLILASGLSQPFYLVFVEDEQYNLPLTLVYIALGYGGMTLGFFFASGRNIGKKISEWLPIWNWNAEKILLPGAILLAIGLGNSIIAFAWGILGYQKVNEVGQYDGLLFLSTLFWLEASFILWLCIFRTPRLRTQHYAVIGLLLLTTIIKAVFQGNRGSLISIFFMVACAFIFSVKRIETRHKIYGAGLLVATLVIGMIYGTTFRSIKTNESRVGLDEYVGTIGSTFDKISNQDATQVLGDGVAAITERIESVSSLAVIVSNYEKLEPYEESYGLRDNIWNDTITAFIPRPLWKDKPMGSDPRRLADLYFSFGENSFTVTPMGDLLRNFGPLSIPLGMFFIGFVLSVIYSTLVENQAFSFWRTTLYYILLTSVSYEGFYGTIAPQMAKYGLMAVIGLLFIRAFQGRRNRA